MKRAFLRNNWAESSTQISHSFVVKWEFSDAQNPYKNLMPTQFYNHFPDSRELTTKQGLTKLMNTVTEYGVKIDKFYPRCYDLSENSQIDEFQQDFARTAVLNCLKKHAKYFKQHCK